MNPDSPAEIRAALEERGLALKKRWGQNFLVNRGARERLVSLLELKGSETVWEIGPGLGSMTGLLLERAKEVRAFEMDRGLCRFLLETFAGTPAFKLVQGDFLESWRNAVAEHGPPDRLLGNLPYRTASLMIGDLIEGGLRPRVVVVTVQRELAERMASGPGTKSYSSFSVLCQSSFHVIDRGDLQPGQLLSGARGCFFDCGAATEERCAGQPHAARALRALSRSLFLAKENHSQQPWLGKAGIGRDGGGR